MWIGELLLTRMGLSQDELSRALDEQARSGGRLCSLLISRGAIEFDVGARALAEQSGTPCALARHLAKRDLAVAQLISPELARELCVLPIGRSSTGAVIVAVRDPDPHLHATLQQAIGSEIAMAITPATRLERLVIGVYGDHLGDFEVEVDSRVDAPALPPAPSPTLASPTLRPSSSQSGLSSTVSRPASAPAATPSSLLSPLEMLPPASEPQPPAPQPQPLTQPPQPLMPRTMTPHPLLPRTMTPQPLPAASTSPAHRSSLASLASSPLAAAALAPSVPPLPDLDLLNPDTLRMSLSPLDDTRVAKDPSQSGLTISRTMSSLGRAPLPPVAQTLATTRAALAFAESRDSATDVAMTFISGRWRSALIAAVRGASAIGYRGHGIASVSGIELSLDPGSIVGHVVATKQASTLTGASVAADPLGRVLNLPTMAAAAPVLVSGEVVAVIAAGDSAHGPADPAALDELTGIATALGETYQRIRRA